MNGPLCGINVLDLCPLLPGALCTRFLADFGAEVIRIDEPPGGKRRGRRAQDAEGVKSKEFSQEEEELTAAFDCVGRNKKSIALDLKTEEGRKVIWHLVEHSDILVEGFRPGVAKRLGIGYEDISRLNPKIIYCSISLFGQEGPYCVTSSPAPIALSLP